MAPKRRSITGLATLVLALGLAWNAVPKAGPEPGGQAHQLDSFDDYRKVAPRTSDQIVFIGLDGATWNVIDPLIEAGELPTFERLKKGGASGVLRSVDCYFSPPAWTSLMTGFAPENTGVYTFGKWVAEEQKFVAFSSLDVAVPHIWDIASAVGRRVAVTNVPLTYPVHPVNGIMVAGLMTPIVYHQARQYDGLRFKPYAPPFAPALDAQSYATKILASVPLSVTRLMFALYDTVDDDSVRYDTVAMKVLPEGKQWAGDKVPLYTFKVGEHSPWFQFDYRKGDNKAEREPKRITASVIVEPGKSEATWRLRITPLLRLPNDPDLDLTFPKELGDEIEKDFGYYLITMTYSDDLIPKGTEQTAEFASYFYNYDDWDLFFYVFQAPDNAGHAGRSELSATVYKTIDGFLARLIEELPEDVTLVLASDHGFAEYEYIVGLNEYFEDIGVLNNARHVNYDSTLVFHNQWCLYFNDDLLTNQELKRRGIEVNRGQSPRAALIDYLKAKCGALTEDGLGAPIELIEIPEDAAGTAPDMVVRGGYERYYVEGTDFRIRTANVVRPTQDRLRWFHDQNGIYLLWGNKIKRGLDGGVRNIEDITPTLLYLADLPMSRDFDGEVCEDLIRPEVVHSKPRYYVDDYFDQSPVEDRTLEELESLEEKLRSLGYIR